jgi:3-hydroxyisobutyrate dehydrogenase
MTIGAALAGSTIMVIGLGAMGAPMARRLIGAGARVLGVDPSPAARARLADEALTLAADAAGLPAKDVDAVITMLPDGAAAHAALIGSGLSARLSPGALVLEMSSSRPTDTQSLARALDALGLALIDAPVSGGVRRAVDGTLSIMVGGPAERLARAQPILGAMGRTIIHAGPIGAGHAMKALNNYVSAAGLVAACEALAVGARFGIDPTVMTDALNASTGRNNSTEVKLKPFIVSRRFDSGFAMALMAKDLGIAADLADTLDLDLPQIGAVAALWAKAAATLGPGADHTEIARYLEDAAKA